MLIMNWRKWCDDFVLAGKGILLATKEKRFWYGFVPSFLFFGLLMNLLAGGASGFGLLFDFGPLYALKTLAKNLLATFGLGLSFLDWLPIFAISILQGILIGLIVLLWNKKQKQNSENLEKAGLITGLIALGAGCPTCGTTLITPVLSALFSTGGLAIAGTISIIITWLAVIIAIFALKRLGLETYVIIIHERFIKKKEAHAKSH